MLWNFFKLKKLLKFTADALYYLLQKMEERAFMDLVLKTTLTPDEVVTALRKSCPAENWFFLPQKKDVIFLFYDKKDRMYLYPVLWMRNSVRQNFYITLERRENDTLIRLEGKCNTAFKYLTVTWFGLLLIFMVMAVCTGNYFLLLPLAAMGILAIVFILIMRRFAGKEEPEIRDALIKLINDLDQYV